LNPSDPPIPIFCRKSRRLRLRVASSTPIYDAVLTMNTATLALSDPQLLESAY
jgi:hypothetical protein